MIDNMVEIVTRVANSADKLEQLKDRDVVKALIINAVFRETGQIGTSFIAMYLERKVNELCSSGKR